MSKFTNKTDALWDEMTAKVKALVAEFGEEKFNKALEDAGGFAPGMVSVEDGKVEFLGTLDDIANVLDKTEEVLDNATERFKWVAWCRDRSYEDESEETFEDEKDAYDAMRQAAFDKACWNTEYDEDFDDVESIGYEFKFSPETISHSSYSGTYYWHVLPEGEELTEEEKKEIEDKIWD